VPINKTKERKREQGTEIFIERGTEKKKKAEKKYSSSFNDIQWLMKYIE
jgi:hypothetical protein